jgi:hypothetical protein
MNEHKVIGYFAMKSKTDLVCTPEGALVICRNESCLTARMKKNDPVNYVENKLIKTRYGEIISGLKRGAAYAFDLDSYVSFYNIGIPNGLLLENPDTAEFLKLNGHGFGLIIVSKSVLHGTSYGS